MVWWRKAYLCIMQTTTLKGKLAAYTTLGCKLNFSETATFARRLADLGVRTAEAGEQADICIVNTCSVTDVADQKCRHAIRKMVRDNPGAFVVVTGCYAQLAGERLRQIEGVDLVLGSNEKASLVERIAEAFCQPHNGHLHLMHSVSTEDIMTFQPSCSRGNRTRYFLKVQDGCDFFCTYCTIPFARGRSRNPSIASLVAQAEEAARDGGKEIVLTGVNIGDFGRTTGERFVDLVKALDGVAGISRYRISSLEPDHLSSELIDVCGHSRAFMPHFHIPLQSGSDEVLRLMGRHYRRDLFARKVNGVKAAMPNAFIGVDVMVGCRGERPELFDECYCFLQSLPVTQLHVFPYSERPGTKALDIPYIVDEREKHRRVEAMIGLSEEKRLAFYAAHQGREAKVLFEKAVHGKPMHGFTENYIRAELPPQLADERLDNQIVGVRLGGFNEDKSALTVDKLYI